MEWGDFEFMKHALLLSVLALCSMAVSAADQPKPAVTPAVAPAPGAHDARFPDIEHKDLVKLIAEKKVVLIDCNGTESYKEGHIPGAVDFEAVGATLEKVLPADKSALVVSYCGSPVCPAYKQGAEAALKLGYTNVKHYANGITGWKESGEKTAQ
jgi:rhodanese-related sulfurtransferase